MAYSLRNRMDEKKKRVMVEQDMDSDWDDSDSELFLKFRVDGAEGIDETRPLYSPYTRRYMVYAWINPGEGHQLRINFVNERPDPLRNPVFLLLMGDFDPAGKYLHLEVVRFEEGSKDPEPSNREVLVGRTRIRLPDELSKVKSGWFQLVKLHDDETTRSAGFIGVSMQVKRDYSNY